MPFPGALAALLAAAYVVPLLILLWLLLLPRFRGAWTLPLVSAFAYGAFAGFLLALLLLGSLASAGTSLIPLAVVLAPLLEEPVKAVAPLLLWRRLARPVDGLAAGLAAGLGFAATENALYVLLTAVQGGAAFAATTLASRTVGALLLHAGATALVGYGLQRARHAAGPRARVLALALALLAAVGVHATFNHLTAKEGWLAASLATGLAAGLFAAVVLRLARTGDDAATVA